MDVFEFIKKYCPVGNADLILLYAFKNNWKVTIPELRNKLKLNHAHIYRILRKMEGAGFCRRKKPEKGRTYIYEFNGSSKYLLKRDFEKKITPYIGLTPEKFLKTEKIDFVIKIE
ncbi:MAG: hypothetical protein DRN95_02710 [Candidatus Hydrothermarchaeota archaeon]|nr:MAG: hypothetical protein DRN95_02710 [Candidatus Hydrothermarchaeota archaeon]